MAYYRLEPFGSDADDWRMAQLLALIANVNRDPKRRPRPFEPEEFMPVRGPRPALDQAGLRARVDAAMAAWGGVTRR